MRTRNTKRQSYFVNYSIDILIERTPRKEAEERVDTTTRNSEEQLWKHHGRIIVTFSVDIEAHVIHPLSLLLVGKGVYANPFDTV